MRAAAVVLVGLLLVVGAYLEATDPGEWIAGAVHELAELELGARAESAR